MCCLLAVMSIAGVAGPQLL